MDGLFEAVAILGLLLMICIIIGLFVLELYCDIQEWRGWEWLTTIVKKKKR